MNTHQERKGTTVTTEEQKMHYLQHFQHVKYNVITVEEK